MTVVGEDRNIKWALVVAVALIAGITVLYFPAVYNAVGGLVTVWVYDVLVAALALACAALALRLAFWLQPGERLRTIWMALGIALLLWGAAEAIFLLNELVLNVDPYPSLADFLWVVGYIPLYVALILRYRSLRVTLETGRVIGVFALFAGLAALAIAFVIQPIVVDVESTPVERLVSALYPLGDLGVAFFTLLIFLALTGGTLSWPWACITAGFLTVALADLLYIYANWQGIYAAGQETNLISVLSDIPYFASYVIMAFGLYVQARLQRAL